MPSPCFRHSTLAALIVLAGLSLPVHAQEEAEEESGSRYPTTEFADEAARSASVTVGSVTAGISQALRPEYDPSLEVPVLQVTVDDKPVLETPGVPSGMGFVAAEASIAEIDPDNSHPEIYFASYSGGAHCCNHVVVAEENNGSWVAVTIGDFDGDGNYLNDLDGDGLAEIATVDNRFLYTFDCYACSAAPLTVTTVRKGEVLDISADPRFLPAHRDWLEQIEGNIEEDRRWTSKGYLAGWIAAKIRVGEGAEAWQQFTSHWDLAADDGEEVCTSGEDIDSCPRANRKRLKFPDELKLFLERTGYLF